MSLIVNNAIAINTHPRSASTAIHHYFGVPITPENHHVRMESQRTATVMRNSFDLLVSWFILSGYEDFDAFLLNFEHDQFRQPVDGQLTMYYLYRPGDIVLHYHRLTAAVQDFLGYPFPIVLSKHNETKGKEWWPLHYTSEQRELASSRFANDFALWFTLGE